MARFTVVAVLLLLFVVALTKAQSKDQAESGGGEAAGKTSGAASDGAGQAEGGAGDAKGGSEGKAGDAQGQTSDNANKGGDQAQGAAGSGRRRRSLVHHLVARDVAEHHSGRRQFSDSRYPGCRSYEEEEYTVRRTLPTRGTYYP